jgi:hypothetical protein
MLLFLSVILPEFIVSIMYLHKTHDKMEDIISFILSYTTLHYLTLPYTTLHYLTLPYTTLHYLTLPCVHFYVCDILSKNIHVCFG